MVQRGRISYARYKDGVIFLSEISKLSVGSQKLPLHSLLLKLLELSKYSCFDRISSWATNWATKLISVFFLCFVREQRLYYDFSAKMLVFLRRRGCLGEIESKFQTSYNLSCTFLFASVVSCLGYLLQISSPNSQ